MRGRTKSFPRAARSMADTLLLFAVVICFAAQSAGQVASPEEAELARRSGSVHEDRR